MKDLTSSLKSPTSVFTSLNSIYWLYLAGKAAEVTAEQQQQTASTQSGRKSSSLTQILCGRQSLS